MNKTAIMAIGHMQSSMYSCDGGQSWQGYQSASDTQRCWVRDADNFDCDHDSTSGRGVVYGDGGFMATFGWGTPGEVVKTTDGVTWSQVQQGRTFAGVAWGNGSYYLNSRRDNLISTDNGATWITGNGVLTRPFNQRKTFFIPGGGGRFVSLANSGGDNDLFISKDGGLTFARPDTLPMGCGNGSWALGNNRVMVLSDFTCISDDNADNWSASPLPGGGNLVFNGTHFRAYSRDGHFFETLENQINWQRRDVTLDGQDVTRLRLGRAIYVPALNRYAAISQRSQNWYEATEFYWSDDGIDWHQVDKTLGTVPMAPHPVRETAVGYLPACEN